MANDLTLGRPARRSYTKIFKAQVVRECAEPDVSVAGVALAHGINANLVHKWRRQMERGELVVLDTPGFIPLGRSTATPLPMSSQAAQTIHIELEREDTRLTVAWPVQASAECAAWLHDLLR